MFKAGRASISLRRGTRGTSNTGDSDRLLLQGRAVEAGIARHKGDNRRHKTSFCFVLDNPLSHSVRFKNQSARHWFTIDLLYLVVASTGGTPHAMKCTLLNKRDIQVLSGPCCADVVSTQEPHL